MRHLKFSEIIGKSMDRSSLILFKPFSFKKWRGLIVIAFLAGTLFGGCNLNFGGGGSPRSADQKTPPATATQSSVSSASGAGAAQGAVSSETTQQSSNEDKLKSALDFFKKTWQWWVLGLAVLMAFAYLLSWYLSPCRFVWIHSIIQNESAFWKPFKQYRGEGNRFFIFSLCFGLISLAVIGILLAIGVVQAQREGLMVAGAVWSFGVVARVVLIPLLFLFAYTIPATLVYIVILDFGLPIMMIDQCSAGKAWASFREIYKGHAKDFWLYLLIKTGLMIAAGILSFLIILLGIVAFALAGVVVFGLAYLVFMVLLKWQIFFFILAFMAAVPFIYFLIYFLFAANLPFSVFFQCFALYFLSSFKTRYQPLPIE